MIQAIGIIIGVLGVIAGITVWLKPNLLARIVSIMFLLGGIGILIVAFLQ